MLPKGEDWYLVMKRQRQIHRAAFIFILSLAMPVFPGPVRSPDRTAAGIRFYAEVTIAATGDIMVHSPQFKAQYQQKTGVYDFTNNFRFIKPISSGDLALANLETTFGGKPLVIRGSPGLTHRTAWPTPSKTQGLVLLSPPITTPSIREATGYSEPLMFSGREACR